MPCRCDNQMGELLVDDNPYLYDHPHYEDPLPVFTVGGGSNPVMDEIGENEIRLDGGQKNAEWLILIPIALVAYWLGRKK